jgi:hypothetical protein
LEWSKAAATVVMQGRATVAPATTMLVAAVAWAGDMVQQLDDQLGKIYIWHPYHY